MALNVGAFAGAAALAAVVLWKLIAGQISEPAEGEALVAAAEPTRLHVLGYLGGGLFAGFCGAILGVGGGFFAVPFLVLVMGLTFPQAVAASVVTVVATSSAAAPGNLRRGYANMRLGITLQLTGMVGVILGGQLILWLAGQQSLLNRLFAVTLLVGSYFLWRRVHDTSGILPHDHDRGRLGGTYRDPKRGEEISYRVARLPSALGLTAVGGITTSLLGLGGGTVNVPVLRLLCGIPMRAAATTSNYMMGIAAAAAALQKFSSGHLVPLVAASLALGTLAGSRLGAYASRFLHGKWIQYAFIGLMVLVAAGMLFDLRALLKDVHPGAALDTSQVTWHQATTDLLRGGWQSLPPVSVLLLVAAPLVALAATLVAAVWRRAAALAVSIVGVVALLVLNYFVRQWMG